MTIRKLTPWFPGNQKPFRVGVYRIQDYSLKCNCCWMNAHWNGEDWFYADGRYLYLLILPKTITRWRGLSNDPNKE
jgi:hypothetical protein